MRDKQGVARRGDNDTRYRRSAKQHAPQRRDTMFLGAAGIVFIYGSVAAFAYVCLSLSRKEIGPEVPLQMFTPEIIMSAIGVFGALLGVRLLRSVGATKAIQPSRVVNKEEWDAICEKVREGNEEVITQYIRLTSLGGVTGAFTKLGLTGLPLATIGLTLFFSVLSIWYDTFMDLAKLTLGAFIGSFVQKQVGASQGGAVRLPSGETVKVQSAPPDSF